MQVVFAFMHGEPSVRQGLGGLPRLYQPFNDESVLAGLAHITAALVSQHRN